MPPRTTAAMIGTRKLLPVDELNAATMMPMNRPARPQRAPEMTHARSMTIPVRTPQLLASSGLVAVARIAFPSFVHFCIA